LLALLELGGADEHAVKRETTNTTNSTPPASGFRQSSLLPVLAFTALLPVIQLRSLRKLTPPVIPPVIVSMTPVIPMTLDKISRPGTGAGSDQRTFTTAD
jgi:hypothetical protein